MMDLPLLMQERGLHGIDAVCAENHCQVVDLADWYYIELLIGSLLMPLNQAYPCMS